MNPNPRRSFYTARARSLQAEDGRTPALLMLLCGVLALLLGVVQFDPPVPAWARLAMVALAACASLSLARSRVTRWLARAGETIRAWAGDGRERALFDANPAPSILVAVASRRIVAANPAALALYGYPLEQLCGRGVGELRAQCGDDASAPHSGLQRHRRSDGSHVDVELTVDRARWRGGDAWFVAVRDVTARIDFARELEASERRFREIFELNHGMVFTHDLDGRLLLVNDAMAHALGYRPDDLVGSRLEDIVEAAQRGNVATYLHRIREFGQDAGSGSVIDRTGREQVWEFRNRMYVNAKGEGEVLCCAIDVSDRRSYERDLVETSRTDPLTGCYNRRYLAWFSARALADAEWGCVVIDIDRFKRFNDVHGHAAGDRALVDTVQFLGRVVREGDAVVRLGGDEFLILLRHCDDRELTAFASRLQRAHDEHAPVRLSFGSASRVAGESLERTIERADDALLRERKRRGGCSRD
jgi:diguanylate cyclase (GGDEF)-like protein/PAS domain S-box-containing protein